MGRKREGQARRGEREKPQREQRTESERRPRQVFEGCTQCYRVGAYGGLPTVEEGENHRQNGNERNDDLSEGPIIFDRHAGKENRNNQTEQKQRRSHIEIGVEDSDERDAQDE